MAETGKLGKYEIRSELGRGAMGVVYEGFDPRIKRVVALKTIRADQLAGEASEEIIARFRREAEAAGRLTHPNIVAIYDFDEDAGTLYIAMELVRGRELAEIFAANERIALPDVVRIMAQILAALDYSHRQGVVHRDIKPANIFLLADGTAKVADFGIAHLESSNLTQVGTVIGTPAYMSPEQILGMPVDGRSDLFSAGVILYQLLTGERPFSGSATTIMQKVLKESPLPPSSLNVQLPAAFDAVVRRALAKRPEERYQSAQEFAAALAVAGQSRTSPTEVDPDATLRPQDLAAATGARVAAADASPPSALGSAAATPAPYARRPRTWVLMGGAAILTVAFVAWTLTQRNDGGTAALTPTAPPQAASTIATASSPATNAASSAPGTAAAPAPVAQSTAPAVVAAPGTVVVSAVGLADPSNPRYQTDKALLNSDLRADSKGQAVAKALGLLLERDSFNRNYDVLQARLLANSGNFINTVVQESEPRLGKDGLMSLTTQAVVDIKALQKSLNEMTRAERIQLIRASGDPRIALSISVRDTDRSDSQAQRSPIAENVLKERIKSFGFRTWSEAAPDAAGQTPDFVVEGQAKVKKLSTRLEASGLTINKYTLTSWTVKAVDRATGEEIYFNTVLPKGAGSWASEEEALRAIGAKIGDQFSRDFFLQHVHAATRKVTIVVTGLPDSAAEAAVARELVGLPAVLSAMPRRTPSGPAFDLQLSGGGLPGDLVATVVAAPLNAKLGQSCFGIGAVTGEQVTLGFDAACHDAAVLARLESNPPAGLYGAPPGRSRSVISNPETLRKLTI